MQILGDLIKLGRQRDALPLPWWHRAPLGLQSKTVCYATIVRKSNRPVGDVVVSLLNPSTRANRFRVEVRQADQPGVIKAALAAVSSNSSLNIELAESATMDSGSAHDVNLICELRGEPLSDEVLRRIRERLIIHGFDKASIEAERLPIADCEWIGIGEVVDGWLTRTKCHDAFMDLYGAAARQHGIDCFRAVVSADTRNRLMRFVFPRRGARTIKIEHADQPQVLQQLMDILVACDLNALSWVIKRGGALPTNALLVAACEPVAGSDPSRIQARLAERVRALSPDYRARLGGNDGIEGWQTVYTRSSQVVSARMPPVLAPHVQIVRQRVPRDKTPVFVSRRVSSDARSSRIVSAIHEALRKEHCVPLEVTEAGVAPGLSTVFDQVSAHMWCASGAIVVVNTLPGKDAVGTNLPHEFGFFQGQAKPLLLLVEGAAADELRSWTNTLGIMAPRFASDDRAFLPDAPDSILALVRGWSHRLRLGTLAPN